MQPIYYSVMMSNELKKWPPIASETSQNTRGHLQSFASKMYIYYLFIVEVVCQCGQKSYFLLFTLFSIFVSNACLQIPVQNV